MIKFILTSIGIAFSVYSFAQLNINTGLTPSQLVQNVLIGQGVTVSNITYNGDIGSIGEFSNGSATNLGIGSGIVLSSGNVIDIPQSSDFDASTIFSNSGDNDLNVISSAATEDATVLEFDFIPLSDIISFQYVFGSEEYPEWVGSSFNDIFAFFITGPNPLGGNYNKKNIALIPGTTIPVAINNVNNGSYSTYYVDNLSGTTIVYDGFTTVLTAQIAVNRCSSYHIKIAIADAGDGALDSGVFLEAYSFSTEPTTITSVDASCEQSNGSATATVNGTCASGFQYLWNTVPPQSTSTAINLAEGTYVVSVSCGSCVETASVDVGSTSPPTLTVSGTDEICDQQNGTVTADPLGGTGSYTYLWNSVPSQTTQTAINLEAGTYEVTVSDGFCTASDLIIINNIVGPDADFTENSDVLSFFESTITFVDNSTGNLISYFWDFGDGSTDTNQNVDHFYSNQGTYTVVLTVTDVNGCVDTYSKTVVIYDISPVYIPNSFSPNGDGKNDLFGPEGVNIDFANSTIFIYDRYGKLLFYTENINKKWNGTLNNKGSFHDVVEGVYVYKILIKIVNGSSHEYIGRVTLLP